MTPVGTNPCTIFCLILSPTGDMERMRKFVMKLMNSVMEPRQFVLWKRVEEILTSEKLVCVLRNMMRGRVEKSLAEITRRGSLSMPVRSPENRTVIGWSSRCSMKRS